MVRSKYVLLLIAATILSCGEGEYNYDHNRKLSDFADFRENSLRLDNTKVAESISELLAADNGGMQADKHTRQLYKSSEGRLLWVSREGLDWRTDSLEKWLADVEQTGISPAVYRLSQLTKDLETFRSLDFSTDDINKVAARLDYNLTRAYMRYVAGQMFGFVSPEATMNRLYEKEPDSTSTTKRYFRLFDIPVSHADDAFFAKALRMASSDSLPIFLREVQPFGTLYQELTKKLPGTTGEQRAKILCNIERCRWRQKDYPEQHTKYVQVNIPSFSLRAVDGDKKLNMRIGCGAVKTKTPLITSRIIRMDMNPQWIVPKSIAKGIAYNYGYMRKETMFINDKKLGKLPCTESNLQKILAGEQYIVQKGGAGNSLGRIIFRFPNNFSVYMHDTNTPWQLQRENRAISHGCVRLERPFDLAVFILKEKDPAKIDRIRELTTKDSVMRTMEVEPSVPVYINYYTLYPNDSGVLQSYPDVYGYDKAIMERLSAFIRKE